MLVFSIPESGFSAFANVGFPHSRMLVFSIGQGNGGFWFCFPEYCFSAFARGIAIFWRRRARILRFPAVAEPG
jgi:hypothetical protein